MNINNENLLNNDVTMEIENAKESKIIFLFLMQSLKFFKLKLNFLFK